MGILLRILKQQQDVDDVNSLFIDFEKAVPSEAEAPIYNEISPLTGKIPILLEAIKTYSGASELIRKSIANPKDASLHEQTWNALKPLTQKLKEFYDFSLDIAKLFPVLLKPLVGGGNATSQFETHPALAKAFAEIIDFTIRFDEIKLSNPSIQNDLSYYRRVLSHGKVCEPNETLDVPMDLANKISIFLADPTPCMSVLSQTVVKYFNSEQISTAKETTTCFATMIKLCKYMLDNPTLSSRFESGETRKFCMRVMVGLIILYDHVHPTGVFMKSSQVDVKACIKTLKEENAEDIQGLLNSIRYTSKHFNDETTPLSVKEMLNDTCS